MSAFRVLVDECIQRALYFGLQLRLPTLDLLVVGDEGAPQKGTADKELLRFCEAEGRLLISADRETVPSFAADHVRSGRHTHGVCIVDVEARLAHVLDELDLIFTASEPDEWIDQIWYVPSS